jgi:acetyl esterase/lipase
MLGPWLDSIWTLFWIVLVATGLYVLGLQLLRRRADMWRSQLKVAASPSFFEPCTHEDVSVPPSADCLPAGRQFTHLLFAALPIWAQHVLRDRLFALISDASAVLLGASMFGPRRLLATARGLGVRTLSYGPLPRHRIDLIAPSGTRDGSALLPMVVFVHGGAWGSGHRLFYRDWATALANRAGCLVAVVGYRVWPQASCAAQCDDVQRALRYLCARAGAVGGDAERVYVAAHSSGAHVCLLTLLHREHDGSMPPLAGIVALSAPFSPLDHFDFERARGVHEMSPMGAACAPLDEHCCTRLVSTHPQRARRLPPCLVVHGDCDTVVPLSAAVRFAAAMQKAGAVAKLRVVAGANHIAPILDVLSAASDEWTLLIRDFVHGLR